MKCKSVSKVTGEPCKKMAAHNGFCNLHDPSRRKIRREAAQRAAAKRYGKDTLALKHHANGSAAQFTESLQGMIAEAMRKELPDMLAALFTRKPI